MRFLIFDTDVLSTFGKIRRLDLLRKLLPIEKFFIPTSVYPNEAGSSFLVV